MSARQVLQERPDVVRARERRERAETRRDDCVKAVLDAKDGLEQAEADAAEAILDGREPLASLAEARKAHDAALRDAGLANRALEQAREAEAEAAAAAAEELLADLREQYREAVRELDEHLVLAARANDEVRRIHAKAKRVHGANGKLYTGGPMGVGGVIPTGTMPGPLPDAAFEGLTLDRSTSSINPVLYWHEHVGELVGLDLPPLEDIR